MGKGMGGYSAKVRLQLLVGDVTLSLSHVGPSGLIVRGECEPVPPGHAELRITVDGKVDARRVFLVDGIPGAGVPVAYR